MPVQFASDVTEFQREAAEQKNATGIRGRMDVAMVILTSDQLNATSGFECGLIRSKREHVWPLKMDGLPKISKHEPFYRAIGTPVLGALVSASVLTCGCVPWLKGKVVIRFWRSS